MARKAKKLVEISNLFEEWEVEVIDTEDVTVLKELHLRMSGISDPRDSAYVRHELGDIIMITLLAVLSNANEWLEIELFGKTHEKWLRRFLNLEHGIPSDDTFRIVASIINTNYIYGIAIDFLMKKADEIVNLSKTLEGEGETAEGKEILSFDGKSSNASGRKDTDAPGSKPLHTLSAYSSDYGFCVAQNFVGEKTNEITSMPDILQRLDLRNTIATWDALNTQKDIVKTVIAGKGDYVGALKGNQHNFHQDVKDYFEPDVLDSLRKNRGNYIMTKEKEHSAIVTREYFLTDEITWLYGREKWAGLKAIGMELKTTEKNNPALPAITETRYYISSFMDINDFSRAVRGHWGIENGLHWQLDFTFKDDNNTTMPKNGAANLQIFKKLALAILKMAHCLYPKRTSLKLIRFRLAMTFEREIGNIFSMMNVNNLKTTK